MELCTLKFKPGDQIHDFKLLTVCGSGAYGTVFLAENVITRQQLALKIISATGKNPERELKGLQQYQQICPHTDLLQIYHVGFFDGFYYYTMEAADSLSDTEYCPKTLANILKSQGRLTPEEVKSMAESVASALETLHSKGVMHRDIKPENILWVNGVAVPGDIGLISANNTSTLAGTPGFIPPEVVAGLREHDFKDDFYALGKVIYCALTGLPVTEYPSFPDSATLNGAGEIIRLYSRLCAGDSFIRSDHTPKRSRALLYTAAALLLAGMIAGAFWAVRPQPQPEQGAEKTDPVEPAAVQPPPPYTPSQALQQLMPELSEHYRQLYYKLFEIQIQSAQNITRQDLLEAEAYLAKHPGHPMIDTPQYVAEQRKRQQAEAEFDRQHQSDPVWCYFRNQEEISWVLANLQGQAIPRQYTADEAKEKLNVLYQQQRELEILILKKYQK